MENHHEQEHHHDNGETAGGNFRLAVSMTLHCLLGCGLGEVVGMVIGVAIGLGNVATIVLAVTLGFVFGFLLGMRPLLRAKISFGPAFRIVLVAEGLSIGVMETAEVLVEVYTPGVMQAGLAEPIFWMGMGLALAAGFLAALPVNIVLVRKGIRHQH